MKDFIGWKAKVCTTYFYMKRSSTSLTVRDIQIETTVKNHSVPIKLAKIQKCSNIYVGKVVMIQGLFIYCR